MNYCAKCGVEWMATHVCPPRPVSTLAPVLTEDAVRRIVREEIRRALDFRGVSARAGA